MEATTSKLSIAGIAINNRPAIVAGPLSTRILPRHAAPNFPRTEPTSNVVQLNFVKQRILLLFGLLLLLLSAFSFVLQYTWRRKLASPKEAYC